MIERTPAASGQKSETNQPGAATGQQLMTPPTIALPKGGGAICGIGEKFAANPVTGTGAMTVPIATSPGRAGFGPQLSLAYDSGAGNGPFGLGWNLSLPSITRKTDKGLPRYLDAEASDVFILSGAEDLVPVLSQVGEQWQRETLQPRKVGDNAYQIQRYRPRSEGLFARIERWTNQNDPTDVFWRSISKDNITTWYGRTAASRIVDPADQTHIFSWLICASDDDKGNVVVYEYVGENDQGVDQTQANEQHRVRTANRYLKRIFYGNHTPYVPKLVANQPWPKPEANQWFFEVVFDYGEHNLNHPTPQDAGIWELRQDPFSVYRSTFEVRTYRLCQRVLMFHHIPNDPEYPTNPDSQAGYDGLVRSTDFTYEYEADTANARAPIFSKLIAVTQKGHQPQSASSYLTQSLPPVEFTYSAATIQHEVRTLDSDSSENLPIGIDGANYQWVDLDGEGLSGVLTEQANAWFYKRNLSPTNRVNGDSGNGKPPHLEAKFAPLEIIATKPALSLANHTQFLDLAGDGRPDVVQFAGATPGFYERTMDEQWETFVPFRSLPNVDWGDPNLKFVDLNGDGHTDLLISEHDAFVWHQSLGEEGFTAAQRTPKPWDEEIGPHIVFADGEQAIYLADMSGDGLTDIVRIRNGEVCYWPNLGYGRFGAKVTMDNAPWFDHVDQFDQRRLRVADIDGTGTTDLLYLHRAGVRVYFNQAGNGWSAATTIDTFPALDNVVWVQTLDLLGNGTACLVWSSPLPGDAGRALRYLDLMGGQKPHLLVKTVNNLGAETTIAYAPSTKFYLQDKEAGQPWITKLPFPVHCVEKVTVCDKWRQTRFTTTYSYHHGYFDGPEREFRGFGRVEQIDVEAYGAFAAGNIASLYITNDQTLYQPPVKTVTWVHTGAFLDRERILSHFAHEYFPNWLEDQQAGQQVLGPFQENALPEPDLATFDLSNDEWREALRACKGMTLRQEVYELDVDALVLGQHKPVKLFTAAVHNCHIQRLQPQAANRHAVFHVTESEAITYHYELDLRATALTPDPRIAHTLNLNIDEYGNIRQAVAAVYPRLGKYGDDTLTEDAVALIQHVQGELHLAYTETHYTHDIPNDPANTPLDQQDLDNYRLRLPCEVLTYELSGIQRTSDYFTLDELRAYQLSDVYQLSGKAVLEIPYHQPPAASPAQKRLVEQARTLFFDTRLDKPLTLGKLNALGLPYESYTLALSDDLLNLVFKEKLTDEVKDALTDKPTSGYLSGPNLTDRFGDAVTLGQYWLCAGVAGFNADAPQHFYLPERYTDPFGNVTTLNYDARDLYIKASTDAVGNTTRVKRFDFRVLAPRVMQDANDNRSEVCFDALGLPTAMALIGNGTEGDNLDGFSDALANPTPAARQTFFDQPDLDEAQARTWLGNATARHLYYLGQTEETLANGETIIHWGAHPACACGLVREQHVSQLAPGAQSPLQAVFEYSDGLGSVLVKKVQAEPEQPGGSLRWVASGKTILNNKGKPVKQYEPAFSQPAVGHRFDVEEAGHAEGVTTILYYDAVGRTVRAEMPDGSFNRVAFSPWHVLTFDQNDTVLEVGNGWFARKTAAAATTAETRAAQLTAEHAATPALTILDSLGRDVIAIAHNRLRDNTGVLVDEKYLTFTKLDAEGKPLWVQDARGNRVMQYVTPPLPEGKHPFNDPQNLTPHDVAPCYDIAGNLLFQHSMDAGDRWLLNDAAGKPIFAWNSRGFITQVEYDALHRPTGSFVTATGDSTLTGSPRNPALPPDAPVQFEKLIYGEGQTDDTNRNLRGKLYQHYDTAGVVTMADGYDFKGNPHSSQRQLVADYKTIPDWSQSPLLENETFTSRTRYDALNRPIQVVTPHSDQPNSKVNVIRPGYNAANLLERVDLWLNQSVAPVELLDPTTASLHAVTNINYDAKGQRLRIVYNEPAGTIGQPVITEYSYDKETFRLTHLVTTRPNHADATKRRLQDLAYTYDPVGNITHIADQAQPRVFFDNDCIAASNDYRYDALYRLVAATGREHKGQDLQPDWDDSPRMGNPIPYNCSELRHYVESYCYDPVGNILQMSHHLGSDLDAPGQVVWNRRYQYQPTNNQLRCTSNPGEAELPPYSDAPTPQYNQRYTYDLHGNMTTMPHLPLLQWDFQDQLRASTRQVRNDNPPPATVPVTTYYVYDATGQRVRKITENQTGALRQQRLYLGGFEVYREYSGGAVTLERETLHVMDDKQRIALAETRTDTPTPEQLIRYQFGNHLGSASLELDDQAQIISYEEYYPYGSTSYQAVRNQTETAKRYRYTGKERDEESGLYYHGARYYAPGIARWVGCDPVGVVAGLNLFVYCLCRPVVMFDPNGRQQVGIQPGPGGPQFPPWVGPPPSTPTIPIPPTPPPTPPTTVSPAPGPGSTAGTGIAIFSGPVLVGLAVVAAILTFSTYTPHTNEYIDPDTGQKHVFQTYEARDAYLRQKEAEKRILPGANDSSSPKISPGIDRAEEPKEAPPPLGQEPKQAPGPTDHPGSVDAPGNSDPNTSIEAARKETPTQEKVREEDIRKFLESGKKIQIIKKTEKHHIASDKDPKYTPQFKELFENADMTLQDKLNVISIENHYGPHGPTYHKAILNRLTDAVKGLTAHTQAYKDALQNALRELRNDISRKGSTLNQMITK